MLRACRDEQKSTGRRGQHLRRTMWYGEAPACAFFAFPVTFYYFLAAMISFSSD
jgi:hypothetical protein